MKRTIQALFFSLMTIQSGFGVVVLADQSASGNLGNDLSWTGARWFNADTEPTQANRNYAWLASDGFRTNDVNDVFQFTAGGFGGMLEVTDLGADADRYRLLDFDASFADLGLTSAFANANVAANEASPTVTFADPDYSSATYVFGPGTHNVKLEWLQNDPGAAPPLNAAQGSAGGVSLRFTNAIPEPSSSLLAMLGLGFCLIRRRK